METYRERKQSVYRAYAQSYDDDRRLRLGDQALTARMTFVADALSGVGAVLDLGCGTGDLLCTLGIALLANERLRVIYGEPARVELRGAPGRGATAHVEIPIVFVPEQATA